MSKSIPYEESLELFFGISRWLNDVYGNLAQTDRRARRLLIEGWKELDTGVAKRDPESFARRVTLLGDTCRRYLKWQGQLE